MAQLPQRGMIDADGHVLEDANLWPENLEPKYRERPIRIVEEADGREILEVVGKSFPYFTPGMVTNMGTMDEGEFVPGPERAPRSRLSVAIHPSYGLD